MGRSNIMFSRLRNFKPRNFISKEEPESVQDPPVIIKEAETHNSLLGGVTFGGSFGTIARQIEDTNIRLWPYMCHICHTGSMHEVCKACEPLFKRGLVAVKNDYTSNINDDDIRLTLRRYRTEKGRDPQICFINHTGVPKLLNLSRHTIAYSSVSIYGINVLVDINMPNEKVRFGD